MQLKKSGNIRQQLATATCTLLAATPSLHAKAEKWELNASAMIYNEVDRITVYEETMYAKRDMGNNEYMTFKRTHDIMTGASPTGEAKPSQDDIFTTASGSKIRYKKGRSPTGNFEDLRTAFNVARSMSFGRTVTVDASVNYSYEYDYTSLGTSVQFGRFFNQKQTTMNVGFSGSYDRIIPTGGVKTPGSDSNSSPIAPSTDKLVRDLLFGFTQVMSKRTVAALTFMVNQNDGYLNDPYKVISAVDFDGSVTTPQNNFEIRPESRRGYSGHLRGITKRPKSGDVIDLGIRYYQDDWDIKSFTFDLRYRQAVKDAKGKNPDDTFWLVHTRWYYQSKAEFYYYGLKPDQLDFLTYSADYRLAELVTLTGGASYGFNLAKNLQFVSRGELLTQQYLAGKLDPLYAYMFQLSLYYKF